MNNRHKTIDKLNTKDKCPCCKTKTHSEDYYEGELGLVESYTHCSRCGYMNHYAYGNTTLSIGSKSFDFDYQTSPEDITIILSKFNVEFKRFRRSKFFKRLMLLNI